MKRTEADRKEAFVHHMGEYVTQAALECLQESGFFTAPASSRHHGNYEGGLYDHSEMVMLTLVDLTKRLELKWQRAQSPYLVGIFHDLCKADQYIRTATGYEYNKDTPLPGHGDKSAIMALVLQSLTNEEIMCIRYHMGAYEGSAIWDNLGTAITRYPNILWTHTADMYVTKVLGI